MQHRYQTVTSQTCVMMFNLQFSEDEDTPTDEIPSPTSAVPLQNHVDTLQHPSSKYTLNTYVNLEEEEEEEEDF